MYTSTSIHTWTNAANKHVTQRRRCTHAWRLALRSVPSVQEVRLDGIAVVILTVVQLVAAGDGRIHGETTRCRDKSAKQAQTSTFCTGNAQARRGKILISSCTKIASVPTTLRQDEVTLRGPPCPVAARAVTHAVPARGTIIVLSDIRGHRTSDTANICHTLAQATGADVIAPDIFRGNPQQGNGHAPGSKEYERWRAGLSGAFFVSTAETVST
jgi:hypothetical protein